jgi:molybdate transport system regulatory protein
MGISAANQWPATVSRVTTGAVTTELELELEGGLPLVATVTNASAASLDLKVNRAVICLVKASSVMLMTDERLTVSARNQIAGTVESVDNGPVHSRIVMKSDSGLRVVSTITSGSASTLAISQGGSVTAVFKAGQVMVAVEEKQ